MTPGGEEPAQFNVAYLIVQSGISRLFHTAHCGCSALLLCKKRSDRMLAVR